jgi:hypothetical protein
LERKSTSTVTYPVNPSWFSQKDFDPHQPLGTTAANADYAAMNWAGPVVDNGCPATW